MKLRSSFLLPSLVWLAAGCSSVPPIQRQYLQQREIDGLTVSVYPLTTRAEVKHVFKVNLLDRGVLPIQLKAENRNTTNSFVISKEQIVVMNETTHVTNSPGQIAKDLATWSRSRQLGVAAANAIALPASLGTALFLTVAMTPTNGPFVFKPTEENLTGKEFSTRALSPGQTVEGYIYFRFSKPIDSTNAYHVVSPVRNVSTGEIVPFDLKVNLNLNKP